ncbi:AP2-like ethylene-responsive transcription factor PLT2 [Morus notabilis]|uniref:AP2-like ethylene-responsive transcription factor PLT2 n=1 Tax=Morus notabilis TaxID=981085 RepID=W9RQX4_9ROSA|nr:AP2-like ethylene-responsive transcription factor PLT2 [Morus notabilis]
MNSNNWLSFPLSPTHASLPPHLHSSQAHQFSLGLVNDNMDNMNPFQNQEWNLINSHGSSEVPKVADFLGVSKSENQADLVAYNEIDQANHDSDYLFPNNMSLVPVVQQSSALAAASSSANYDLQENPTNNLQSLTLSMGSSGKSSTCETSGDNSTNTVQESVPRRTLDTFGQRTSIYRGVTRHRWTGRYEAHLWDNSCRREGQSRKGRQGGYDKEEKAARAYDLAALKYWGTSTTTNFPISNYEKELEEMKHMTRQEFVASIRRKSSGFSRGASMYRGVTRWQARIGRVAGNKDLYLGTFSTEEEAAEAYDIAAIKFRGLNAVTNFDMNRYDVKSILESNTLPIGGGAAKRLKEAQALESSRKREEMMALSSTFQYGSSSAASNRLQAAAYPLMQFDPHHHPTLLSLQNHHDSVSHYTSATQTTQDPSSFHQNYIQTQLQLHQQQSGTTSYNNINHHHQQALGQSSSNNNSQTFYNGYNVQNHPAFLQGLMDNINMGSASNSIIDHNTNGGSTTATAGYNLGMPSNSTTTGNTAEELALVKVDYDMTSGSGYGGWSGGSGQGSNPSVFTMWND